MIEQEALVVLEDVSPDELEALEEAAIQAKLKQEEQRERLGVVLVKHRDDAIKFRNASGIEQQWAEDQAYYEGEDETSKTLYHKGLSTSSPLIAKPKAKYRSKVFLNITRPYCETAASKVIEVLSPVDDRPWSLEASHIPSFPEKPSPIVQAIQLQAQAAEGQPPQVDQMEEMVKAAKRACAGAQLWIDDKLQACDFSSHIRMIVDDASRLGTGVVRGPTPTMQRTVKVSVDPNTGEEVTTILEEIVPQSKQVSVWNCFPDPACGDNIHDGQFFVEHDQMVEKQVYDLIDQPGYIKEALAHVIEQGPKGNFAAGLVRAPHDSEDPSAKRFHIWYYYGFLKREDVMSLNCPCQESDEIKNVGVPVVVTMINDTPVKAHLNPATDGRFPYDFMCWQKVAGSPFGIGIARQIRSCQAILNSHVRAMMENAGLSSGPQIVIARGSVVPADGSWEITPRKVWLLKADADIQNVANAINSFAIASTQVDLLQAIDFALKMAENVTGLPILLQGQTGNNGVPETVGGMQILVANASSLLRRMARIFDDCLIKPHIQSYYRYMMLYAEDESIKGDFKVVAHGSSALVKRDQRNVFLTQVAPQMMANQAYGIDPTRLFKKIAAISGMDDPESVQFTPEEMVTMQKSAQEAVMQDPKIISQQVAAAARLEVAKLQDVTNQARVQGQYERDVAYIQSEVERTQTTAQAKYAELQLKRELAMLEYANREKLSLDTIKAQLAIAFADNDLQREMATQPSVKEIAEVAMGETAPEQAGMSATAPGLPAIEPPGRAPEGYAQSL